MTQPLDLTNRRFDHVLALSRHPENSAAGKARWLCRCDCGTAFVSLGASLVNGRTISCGCVHAARLKNGTNRTHGLSKTPTYSSWKAMKKRCANPHDIGYHNYGGRGIQVCERWRHSFENFLEDMGPKPTPDASIERRDNESGYSPENCYWLPHRDQGKNTRRCLRFTRNGVTHTLPEWCRLLGLRYMLVYQRMHSYGWSFERAISSRRRTKV